jgi:hypothetical protein
MKIKKIVGFGDSWMYGDELLDPELLRRDPDAHTCFTQNDHYRLSHCFLGLLGQHYGVPIENFGIPGGSLQSSIWTLLWWIEHEPEPENCLVLVGHTESDRMTFFNPNHVHYTNDPPWNKFIHSAWFHATDDVVSPDWKHFFKQYTVLSMCPDLARLNYLQAVTTFDGIAARHQVPMLQFDVMPSVIAQPVPTKIWPDFCLTLWFREHPDNQQRQLIKEHGHPNELGHKVIRDRFIPEIDRVILAV